jgi:hypothetical protein
VVLGARLRAAHRLDMRTPLSSSPSRLARRRQRKFDIARTTRSSFATTEGFSGGPVFRNDDATGDGGETLAARASIVPTLNGPALVITNVSAFWMVDGTVATPDGPREFHHRGRACLWTRDRYTCDPFIVFERERLDRDAVRAFLAAPVAKARLPLDHDGHVRGTRDPDRVHAD